MSDYSKKTLFIFIFILVLSFIFLYKNDGYNIKITLHFQNKSAKDIDNTYSNKINSDLLLSSRIKKVLVISSHNCCSIYLKTSLLLFNKDLVLDMISAKLTMILNNLNYDNEYIKIDYDSQYSKKADLLLVFKLENDDFSNFLNTYDKLYNDVLFKNLSSKITLYPTYPFASAIYYDYSKLKQFRIDTCALVDILLQNNINTKSFSSFYLSGSINSDISSVNDIKNIVIPYKNQNFYTKLNDVFEIKNIINYPPNSKILFNNRPCIVLLISSKTALAKLLLKKMLNNEFKNTKQNKPDIFDISALSSISIPYDDFDSALKICNKINFKSADILNMLCFINFDVSKISNKPYPYPIENDINIFVNKSDIKKLKNVLDNLKVFHKKPQKSEAVLCDTLNVLDIQIQKIKEKYKKVYFDLSKKAHVLDFIIDNYALNEFNISKNELAYSMISYNDALEAGYYVINSNVVPILLKTKSSNSSNFVYSRKNNILYDVDNFVKTTLKEDYEKIGRLNGKYITFLRIYN